MDIFEFLRIVSENEPKPIGFEEIRYGDIVMSTEGSIIRYGVVSSRDSAFWRNSEGRVVASRDSSSNFLILRQLTLTLPSKAGSVIRITSVGADMAYIYDVGDLFVLQENGWCFSVSLGRGLGGHRYGVLPSWMFV